MKNIKSSNKQTKIEEGIRKLEKAIESISKSNPSDEEALEIFKIFYDEVISPLIKNSKTAIHSFEGIQKYIKENHSKISSNLSLSGQQYFVKIMNINTEYKQMAALLKVPTATTRHSDLEVGMLCYWEFISTDRPKISDENYKGIIEMLPTKWLSFILKTSPGLKYEDIYLNYLKLSGQGTDTTAFTGAKLLNHLMKNAWTIIESRVEQQLRIAPYKVPKNYGEYLEIYKSKEQAQLVYYNLGLGKKIAQDSMNKNYKSKIKNILSPIAYNLHLKQKATQHLIQYIKTKIEKINWKVTGPLGGRLVKLGPNQTAKRIPTRVAKIYDLCVKGLRSKDHIQTLNKIMTIGRKAATSTPFWAGKRHQETQDFYDHIKEAVNNMPKSGKTRKLQ